MPTHRLSDMVSILARLGQLHKTVRFTARTRGSLWDKDKVFVVDLEYVEERGETKVEITAQGDEFGEVLLDAWAKFERVLNKGVGQAVLKPPVEQGLLEDGSQPH